MLRDLVRTQLSTRFPGNGRRSRPAHSAEATTGTTQIVIAQLGNDAGAIGAATMARCGDLMAEDRA
jgi:hypothetical protein